MKSLHVLSIGNSFSDDALEYLYDILKNDGYEDLIVANLYIGGCSLEKHYLNAKSNIEEYDFRLWNNGEYSSRPNTSIKYAFDNYSFDIITMQQASHFSGLINEYYNKENNEPYFIYLKKYCLDLNKNKNVKFYWHMTWSYAKDFKFVTFANYNFDQNLMNEKIKEVVEKLIIPSKEFNGIIPNLYVVNKLREMLGKDITRDGFHMSLGIGRYACGISFAKAINPSSSLYSPKDYEYINEEEKIIAKDAVIKVYNEI